jgi:RNA polymerase sigma factor (TIGR02999 family)
MASSADVPTPRAADPGGDPQRIAQLIEGMQRELRALASKYLRDERPDHTLQPTALVNEVCLRLIRSSGLAAADQPQLLAAAATTMRHVLVDYARRRLAQRRGGGGRPVTFDESVVGDVGTDVEVLAVNEAMERLAACDERQARIVEMRFFGGLTDGEIAQALGVSRRTVQGDWQMARAWLRRELAR